MTPTEIEIALGQRLKAMMAVPPFAWPNRDPMHPQAQGKIERWHQPQKNRILLKNYYLPGARE